MPYFREVEGYQPYAGNDADFHFDYNANSGGGQAFFGGSFRDENGNLAQPLTLDGRDVSFAVRYTDDAGNQIAVSLASDERAVYRFVPRGSGSRQMKLQIGSGADKKIPPSPLLAAFLMLPETCGVDRAEDLDRSPLTAGNYWLRSLWLDCEDAGNGTVSFIPKSFVFGGGKSKKAGVSAKVGEPDGEVRFFELDYEQRICDILYAADRGAHFGRTVSEILNHFAAVYRNIKPFEYEECSSATKRLMKQLAMDHPESYSGLTDPLPMLVSLLPNASKWKICAAINEPRNLIFFGAPGTGKSYELRRLAGERFPEGNVRRVTFYPDYTYSQFVGCFKPYSEEVEESGDEQAGNRSGKRREIVYSFVPGPFLETYVKAVQNPSENYLLVIEEINRANPAAVLGDVFQLLDRDGDGRTQYEIAAPFEMKDYLKARLSEYATIAHIPDPMKLLTEQTRLKQEEGRLSLPPNMYLWATMNSADQGVFPMDTAFKRRWDFRYIGINDEEDADVGDGRKLSEVVVRCAGRPIYWNRLRRAINRLLIEGCRVNEDKLLGPFFLSPTMLTDDAFEDAFKSKVLLYLYEDAGRNKHRDLFWDERATYSEVCTKFGEVGEEIFVGGLDGYGILADEGEEPDDEATGE